MTEGQCNQITNDAPKMSSLFPCTCYIIVFRVGIKGNNEQPSTLQTKTTRY